MSSELGPFSTAKKIVVFNPDAPTQVRQVSGVGSPAWVSVGSGTFSECVTATSATGAFNWADLPTGLDADQAYTLAVYASTATAFTDASEVYQYSRSPAVDADGLVTSSNLSVTITPALVGASQPRYSSMQIANIIQGSAPTDVWTVLDPRIREPLDLSGYELRLVVCTVASLGDEDADPIDDTLTASWKYEEGDGLTVGGDDDNQLTIQWDADDTGTVGHYRAILWDVTSKLCICKADFDIEPGKFDTE